MLLYLCKRNYSFHRPLAQEGAPTISADTPTALTAQAGRAYNLSRHAYSSYSSSWARLQSQQTRLQLLQLK
jgi:hypothetical protein